MHKNRISIMVIVACLVILLVISSCSTKSSKESSIATTTTQVINTTSTTVVDTTSTSIASTTTTTFPSIMELYNQRPEFAPHIPSLTLTVCEGITELGVQTALNTFWYATLARFDPEDTAWIIFAVFHTMNISCPQHQAAANDFYVSKGLDRLNVVNWAP